LTVAQAISLVVLGAVALIALRRRRLAAPVGLPDAA
jgi:hypothetical protein